MANAEDYVGRITSYHRGKPNFTATVAISGESYANLINAAQALPAAFDLDTAIGAQLDVGGEWVGRSRYIVTPIGNAWFSWDTEGLGWGQGVWRDPYASDTGLTRLDDDTYRLLLRAKIAANQWDGTVGGAAAALDIVFGGTATILYVEDRQDMHMIMGMAGAIPNALILTLFAGGYIPLKPGGVAVEYVVTSKNDTPIFGWGVAEADGKPLAGWGEGSWAVSPEYALTHDLAA
ncbi:DUF2612 domain-containing protein [Mesorhizobium sp. BR1-1-16]|uniref:DUF2612 domain-containing protein n=1 Tax=Mesorhizobium sp. BR1-1-16 TaxID=2876653 RepID=UPI001CCE2F7C|nr:DUF2612 domain-containing protein [Mesorhizobium sp. BR1-1-16]MBZ9939124.1 DUF2612 domain-containing protein [Mesorhizobium sp. BR1-1-16]